MLHKMEAAAEKAEKVEENTSNASSAQSHFECLVCHAHATGFHFNARSCQACCAFFRRAISLRRNYLCLRQQKGSSAPPCLIHYSQKVLCRACRLAKCLAVGMDQCAVQTPKRGGGELQQANGGGRSYFTKSGLLRNKKFAKGALELLEQQEVCQSSAGPSTSAPASVLISIQQLSPTPSTTPSSSTTTTPTRSWPASIQPQQALLLNSPPSADQKRKSSKIIDERAPIKNGHGQQQQPSPVPPLRLTQTPRWNLLALLVEEEMRIAERRRILFCERPVASLLGKNKFCPFTVDDIKPLRFQEFRRSIRTHILLVYEWLRVWPAFDELRMEDRVTFLRKCVLYHTVLDPCFLTIQVGDMGKFVLPNGGYVSTSYPPWDESWADEPEISHETKVKIYWPLLVPLISACINPMLRLGLKFEEFVALKAIVSLQMTLPDISFTGRALVSRELESLCSSLYKFHDAEEGEEEEDGTDPLAKAERFGNLLLLLTPIIDTANTFVESHHIVQFFGLWEMDSLMLQFLKKKSC